MIRDELARILSAVPEHAGYVTVQRKFLARLYAELNSDNGDARPVDNRLLTVEQQTTKIEYLLFMKLRAQRDNPASPGALMSAASITSIDSLWVHIARLRQKLARLCPELKIETVRNRGYRLVKKEVRYGQQTPPTA